MDAESRFITVKRNLKDQLDADSQPGCPQLILINKKGSLTAFGPDGVNDGKED